MPHLQLGRKGPIPPSKKQKEKQERAQFRRKWKAGSRKVYKTVESVVQPTEVAARKLLFMAEKKLNAAPPSRLKRAISRLLKPYRSKPNPHGRSGYRQFGPPITKGKNKSRSGT